MQSLTKKNPSKHRQSNKFNYQLQEDKLLNLHHTYFEQYDKHIPLNFPETNKYAQYSQYKPDQQYNNHNHNHQHIKQTDHSSFLSSFNFNRQERRDYSIEKLSDKVNDKVNDKWLLQENKKLVLDNNRLSKELLYRNLQNQNLKKELSDFKLQVMRKIEMSKNAEFNDKDRDKDRVIQLTDQIHILLEDNKNKAIELVQLKKVISHLNQQKYHSGGGRYNHYIESRDNRSKSYAKDNNIRVSVDQGQEYNYKKVMQLFGSIKEMYKKIMGLELASLKELWRWLKSLGHCFSCLKQWKHRTRNILKNPSISFPNDKIMSLLEQICSIIS